jgi:hypothetical protein
VRERLRGVDFERVREDVRPFLEPGADIDMLTAGNLGWLLDRRAGNRDSTS